MHRKHGIVVVLIAAVFVLGAKYAGKQRPEKVEHHTAPSSYPIVLDSISSNEYGYDTTTYIKFDSLYTDSVQIYILVR